MAPTNPPINDNGEVLSIIRIRQADIIRGKGGFAFEGLSLELPIRRSAIQIRAENATR